MYIALADDNSGHVTRARGSHTCTWESHVHVGVTRALIELIEIL